MPRPVQELPACIGTQLEGSSRPTARPVHKAAACISIQLEGSSRLIAEARPPAGQVCKATQVLQ